MAFPDQASNGRATPLEADPPGHRFEPSRVLIRPAIPADLASIGRLLEQSFHTAAEAELLDALRAEGWLRVELVAADAQGVIGVVAVSVLERSPEGPRLGALAPLAVAPRAQRAGLGSALVLRAIEASRTAGLAGLVVLGDPALYGRCGFLLAPLLGCRWSGPYLQKLELEPGAAEGEIELTYPPPFDALG